MNTLAHLLVDLLSTAPGLVPLYREHLVLHDALLPHVFMASITQWMTQERDAGDARRATVREVVGVLESHLASGDAEVRELIELSFVETLEHGVVTHDEVRGWFGPELRASAARADAHDARSGDGPPRER